MASMTVVKLMLKIQDLKQFGDLVSAIAAWANEANGKSLLSDAEQRLFNAAVELNGCDESKAQEAQL